jgi:hypothetical protein
MLLALKERLNQTYPQIPRLYNYNYYIYYL